MLDTDIDGLVDSLPLDGSDSVGHPEALGGGGMMSYLMMGGQEGAAIDLLPPFYDAKEILGAAATEEQRLVKVKQWGEGVCGKNGS